MKKFNLFKEIIIVDKENLVEAINSNKPFGIDISGKICYEPFSTKDILIYEGTLDKEKPFEIIFGKNYQVVEDDDRILMKAFSNWQEIIKFNTPRASYDDTTADGVDEFSTKKMEDIGWHATEFDIKYRDLVEVLEKECEGTLICIEQEEPYQFSGLGFLSNLDNAEEVLFTFCQNSIKKLIDEDSDYKRETLSDDAIEAAEFFKIF